MEPDVFSSLKQKIFIMISLEDVRTSRSIIIVVSSEFGLFFLLFANFLFLILDLLQAEKLFTLKLV